MPDAERAREASLRQRNTTLLAENRRLRDEITDSRPNSPSPTASDAPRTDKPATDVMTRADAYRRGRSPIAAEALLLPQKQQRRAGRGREDGGRYGKQEL